MIRIDMETAPMFARKFTSSHRTALLEVSLVACLVLAASAVAFVSVA